MARETVDLYSVEQLPIDDPALLRDFIFKLRADFDAHNHDGSSSRQLQNIIAQTLQVRSAIIGGYKLFEAVVGPTAADYKTVAEALRAGKTRIFVRNGTYANEPWWNLTTAGTTIIGESASGVDITFAQDTTNSGTERCVYIGANNIIVSTMNLHSYTGAAQDLFRVNTSLYFLADNLRLSNTRGAVFHGLVTGLYATVKDCIFDYATISDSTNAKAFNTFHDSSIINCFINISSTTSGWELAANCQRSTFVQCRTVTTATSATFSITGMNTCVWSACYFKMVSLVLETNLDACIIENNGNAPATYFLSTNAFGVRIVNSRIILANSYDIMKISSANCQIMNNYIDGGKKVYLHNDSVTVRGIMFSNNNWVSDYSSAAMDLQVGTNASQAMVLGNVIRNNAGSPTLPTITDGGSSTLGVATNQLING